MEPNEQAPVAAAFLVVFDQKVGYTTAWKRNVPDVDLNGVEYKSLPSGLHTVEEDLVYFIQGSHAGVSVFIQGEADAKHRNAHFVAVGALVPLGHGQLGHSWKHAAELRKLAKEVVKKTSDTRPLELFWKKHRLDEAGKRKSVSPSAQRDDAGADAVSKKRKRAMSEATAAGFYADTAWPIDHPALYIPALLDTFGPLLFPLQRAALLRKRILFLGTPPVSRQAKTVYLTSILSNISRDLGDSLPLEVEPCLNSRPLFSVGVQDIPQLVDRETQNGWLACSTDDILGEKKEVYDLLVVLPSFQAGNKKQWPKLKLPDGILLKASQRDLRKWKLLRREIRRLKLQSEQRDVEEPVGSVDDDDDDEQPLLSMEAQHSEDGAKDASPNRRDEGDITEPSSWPALAYRGFMWWASAGEAQAWENDELKADEELLFDMPDLASVLTGPGDNNSSDPEEKKLHYARAAATLIVAYFRRINEQLLRTMADAVESADDETETGIEEEQIEYGMDDLREMGLDSWSVTDKLFLQEMVKKWFGREAVVVDDGVKICGVRVC